jgi:class 3 adenylate cyclase/pimeloyl-ACP methyl ester carboxylesterase
VDAPEPRYLERDGSLLAYQVVGSGAADVLWLGELGQHFDLAWTDPYIHQSYELASAWSRSVYMQTRGLGLSDPIRYVPSLEQQADDVLAVLDAAEMHRATLVGSLTTCGVLTVVAAKAPERVAGLLLFRPLACGPLAPDAEQHGWTTEEAAAYTAGWRDVMSRWGSGATAEMWDPVLATPYNRRLLAMLERCSAKPAFALAYLDVALRHDLTPYLPAIQAPTRVLYAPTTHEPRAVVHRVAELIPTASFVELPPTPPGASIGETYIEVWRNAEEIATGAPARQDSGRFLGTVLFTDLVASTELLARIGDVRYRDLHAAHERQVRLSVEGAGGRLANVTGDGTFSIFDGPTKAVRCAEEILRGAAELGLDVRAGVHTGELQATGHDVTGLSVHIGARIGSLAAPGEVLVSSTVHDLVLGSGLDFTERGSHELKGVPGRWALYALAGTAAQPPALPAEPSLETPLDRAALRTARVAPRAMRAALRLGNAVQRYRAGNRSGATS